MSPSQRGPPSKQPTWHRFRRGWEAQPVNALAFQCWRDLGSSTGSSVQLSKLGNVCGVNAQVWHCSPKRSCHTWQLAFRSRSVFDHFPSESLTHKTFISRTVKEPANLHTRAVRVSEWHHWQNPVNNCRLHVLENEELVTIQNHFLKYFLSSFSHCILWKLLCKYK